MNLLFVDGSSRVDIHGNGCQHKQRNAKQNLCKIQLTAGIDVEEEAKKKIYKKKISLRIWCFFSSSKWSTDMTADSSV